MCTKEHTSGYNFAGTTTLPCLAEKVVKQGLAMYFTEQMNVEKKDIANKISKENLEVLSDGLQSDVHPFSVYGARCLGEKGDMPEVIDRLAKRLSGRLLVNASYPFSSIVSEVQAHIGEWNALPHISIFSEVDKLIVYGASEIFQTVRPITISNLLSWLLVFIAAHTEHQQTIRRELNHHGIHKGSTDFARMSSLPFLESAICETARMISSAQQGDQDIFFPGNWTPSYESTGSLLALDLGGNSHFSMMILKVITVTILHKYFLFLQGPFPAIHTQGPSSLPSPSSPALLRVRTQACDEWYLRDCGTYIFYNFFYEIPVRPRVGTMLPSSFLLRATYDAFKAPKMLDNFMYDLQEKVGLNETVWGLKWEIPTRAHKWELYFYGVPWAKNRSPNCHLTPFSDCSHRSIPALHPLLTQHFGSQETLPKYNEDRMVLFSCDILCDKKDGQDVVVKGEGYHLYYADSPLRSPLKAHSVHLKSDGSVLHENDFTGWSKNGGFGEMIRELKNMVVDVFGQDAWNGENEWLVEGWQDTAQIAIAHKAASPSRPRSIAIYYFGFASFDKFVNLMNAWQMPTHLGEQVGAHKEMLEHLIIEFGCDMIVDPVTKKPKTIKVGIFGSV